VTHRLVAAAVLLSLPNAAAAATNDQSALIAELQRQIAAQQAQIDAQTKAIAELRGLVVGTSGPAPNAAVADPVVAAVEPEPAASVTIPVVAAGEPQPAVAVSAPTKTPDHVVRVGNADVMLGGAFTLNTLVSSRRTIGPAGSVFFLAPPDVTGRDNVIDMTAQYSRISLGIDIPAGDDWTVSARTLFTFFNGSLLNASYGFQPLFGYGSASNGRLTFSAGLMFELFSPRQPDVVDSVSALYFSGNPANSPRAQLRAEWRAPVASGTQFEAALALSDPISTFISEDLTDRTEDNGIPNIETRLAVTHAPDGWSSLLDRAKWDIGVSAVYGEFRKFYNVSAPFDVRTNQSRGVSIDAGVSLSPRVALQGEVWTGQALGNYGAAIGASGNPVTRREIDASGGWGEVAWYWTPTWHSHVGMGVDTVNAAYISPTGFVSNRTAFLNLFWDPSPKTTLAIEGTWRKTAYGGLGENSGYSLMLSSELRF
jgi:hypothetical protein